MKRFTEEALANAKKKAMPEAIPYLEHLNLDTKIKELGFFKGRGCDKCAGTGLKGRQGVYEVCAGVTLPNDASVGLHESLGFRPVGVYRDIAYKFGEWRSVGWWQMSLRPRPDGEPPAELGPPQRLPVI